MMVSYEGQCHLIFWRNEKPVTKASSKHFLKPYKKNFILKDKQNEVHPAHLKIKGDLACYIVSIVTTYLMVPVKVSFSPVTGRVFTCVRIK